MSKFDKIERGIYLGTSVLATLALMIGATALVVIASPAGV